MGNRVKGRVKKKSIKAALSSSAGSKRKLSRMGKKQKKENAGLEASFIGRSKCLKMLQITIKDFRRLCILKGIYPRQPLGRVPGNKKAQTFYHIRDIRAIAHEPILEKFREFKAFMKKVRRAAGRNEVDEANRKNDLLPSYTLHHLVKERYPRFVDALSDLDDALTLTYLFAALPCDRDIKSKYINKAKALAAAWGAYCATTSSITKSFISIKGVYMEASIHGIPIRWIVPHSFTQHLPEDVDFRVMNTFLEFYETMLNFILFKLYNDIGLRYPFSLHDLGSEVVGSTSTVLGANLRALTIALNSSSSSIGGVVSRAVTEDDKNAKSRNDDASKVDAEKKKSKELFKSVGAVLNRLRRDDNEEDDDDDVDEDSVDIADPLNAALENVADEEERTFGVGTTNEVDDETLKRKRLFQGLTFFLSREVPRGYLELVCLAYGGKVGWEGDDSPVSINDSTITHHIVDRPKLPSGYETLSKSREYVQPQWILDSANFMFLLPISRYAVGANLPPHLSPWVDDEEEGYKPAYAEEIERLKNGESVAHTESFCPDANREVPVEKIGEVVNEEEDEEEVSEEEEESDEEAPAAKERQERKRKKEEAEANALAKTMMNRKAAHLYGRMQHGIARKKAKVDSLHERRRELEGKESGKSVLKQKVERLKKERKSIESAYSDTGGSMKKHKKR